MRWELAQDVLLMARKYFNLLKKNYGDIHVELTKDLKNPQAYPKFRILDNEPFRKLCDKIFEDFCEQHGLIKNNQIDSLKKFVLCPEVSENEDLSYLNEELKNKIILLRGYFAFGILFFAFSKSYRVDYGVNFKNFRLLQAVPYRAKDVPAERAQFSHTDVYILLTVLNYYYSGIDKDQFKQLLGDLDKKQDKSRIYETWINGLSPKVEVNDSLNEYCRINLSDSTQINMLYKLFSHYPPVINFWMNNFLFPREAKEYTEELSTSAWDLCDRKPNPTTGFSGTNDSRYLLPINMEYISIDELKGTNGSLLYNLVKAENNFYDYLKPGEEGIKILCKINKIKDCNLVLDVGALMVGVGNEELCKIWLKKNEKAEAAIFFDDKNNLTVLNRELKSSSYELSPYKNNLKGCVVYLDEYHTRGTDLKIPKGTVGAVTLGKNVTKDKLMQACMRMRMLGEGHSVRFFASFEVHNKIESFSGRKAKIGARNVVEWAIEMSREQIVNGFLLWALQGNFFIFRFSFLKIF
jgi:hypothetical protein